MAEIKIRLEVNPNAETEKIKSIANDNSIAKPSNTSFKVGYNGIYDIVYSTPPEYAFNGIRGLCFAENTIIENGQEIKENGLLITDDGYVSNYDGSSGTLTSEQNPIEFVWGAVPKNKKYSVKLTITGEENNLKDLVFYGDRNADQYPTRAIIDGDTDNPIYSDDYKWVINLLEEKQTHTIEFTDWNRANYNAVLVLMRVTLRYYDIDKFSGLDSFETQLQSNSQPKEIFYGCVPNSNSADISAEEELIDMIVDEVIPNSNLPIEIYENGNKISNHITTDSDLTTEKVLNFQSSDHLSLFDQIQFKGRPFSIKANSSNLPTLYDIATYVFVQTLGMTRNDSDSTKDDFAYMFGDTIIVKQNIEMTIKEYLQNIKVPYDYLEADNLRATIDKICTIAQLNFIETAENIYPKNLKFVTARPIRPNTDENVLLLPLSMCLKAPQKDIILKNKYDGVEISEIEVQEILKQNEQLFKYEKTPNNYTNADNINIASKSENKNGPAYKHFTYIKAQYENITIDLTNEQLKTDNLILYDNIYTGKTDKGASNINWSLSYNFESKPAYFDGDFPTSITQVKYVEDNFADVQVIESDEEYFNSMEIIHRKEMVGKITTNPTPDFTKGEDFYSMIEFPDDMPPTGGNDDYYKKASLTNLTNVDTAEVNRQDNDNLSITFKILVALEKCSIVYDAINATIVPYWCKSVTYTPKKLYITFRGDTINIDFNKEKVVGDKNSNNISIDKNTILQSGTVFQNAKISTVIQENILTDYKDGIATATFNCLNKDIKGVDGTVKRTWENGETFKIGDIVKPIDDRGTETKPLYTYKDGSPMYFKVTGITHKYDGVPLQDLELQEVKTPKE